MASDQTAREVIAEYIREELDRSESAYWADGLILELRVAGYVIVRKPTDDGVEAARQAYADSLLAQKPDRNTVTAMAAALAAANAVEAKDDDATGADG